MAVKVAVYGTADMKQITAAQRELDKLRKSAETNSGGVTGAMAKAQASFNNFSKSVTSASGLMSGILIGAVVNFGKAAITAFADSERIMANLENTIQNTGVDWGVYSGKVDEAIAKQEQFGDDDEDLAQALDKFTLSTGNASAALQNLSLIQDFSHATGKNLTESATMLAKAYNGNTVALKKMGIEVDAGASGMEVMDAVAKKVTGSTAKWAEGTDANISKLSNAFENLTESVGKTAVSLGANDLLANTAKEFQDITAWIEKDDYTINDLRESYRRFFTHTEKLPEVTDNTKDMTGATLDAAAAAEDEAEAVERLVRALDGQMVAEDTLEGRQRSHAEASLASRQADLDLKKAQQDVNDAIAEYGPKSDEAAAAQIRVEQASLRARDATVDLTEKYRLMVGLTPEWQASMDARTKKMDAFQKSTEEAAITLDKLDHKLGGGDATRAAANYGGLDSERDVPGYAVGGIVSAPTYALIGEAGPEVVIPLSDPGRAADLMAQSGLTSTSSVTVAPGAIQINASGGDPNAIAAAVEEALKRIVRNSYALGRA